MKNSVGQLPPDHAQLNLHALESSYSNELIWDEIQPELKKIDPDAGLPKWAILYDKRQTPEEKTQQQIEETSQMDFIDRVFDQMLTDGLNEHYTHAGHPGIDQELRTSAKIIILSAQRVRFCQGLEPLPYEALLIICYEMWNVDRHFQNKNRQSGGLYARKHLFGSCLNLIREIGLTGLPSILAALHHDDVEDLPELHQPPKPAEPPTEFKKFHKPPRKKKKPSKKNVGPHINTDAFLCEEFYNPKPLIDIGRKIDDEESLAKILAIQEKVAQLVRGVTKSKDEDLIRELGIPSNIPKKARKEYQDATSAYILLQETLLRGPRIIGVRCGDRSHNITDLEGKNAPDETAPSQRQQTISSQTSHFYARIARVIGLQRIYNFLLEHSFRFSNPEAVAHFEKRREEQFERFLGPIQRGTRTSRELRNRLRRVKADPRVEYIALRPRQFAEVANPEQIDNPEYRPLIDGTDPMFELYIQLKPIRKVDTNKPLRDKVKKDQNEIDDLERELAELPGDSKYRGIKETKLASLKDRQLENYRKQQLETVRAKTARALKADLGEGWQGTVDYDSSSGVSFKSHNHELFAEGCQSTALQVRINDRQTEMLRPRGLISTTQDRLPEAVRSAFDRILKKTRHRLYRLQIFDLLDREVLQPKEITVYTPKGDEIKMLEGQNCIDFAARIHQDLLDECKGFVVRDEIGSGTIAREIGPLDPIPDRATINVVTDLDHPDAQYIKKGTAVELDWMCFASSQGQEKLREVFTTREKMLPTLTPFHGLAYLETLREVFNFQDTQQMTRILSHLTARQSVFIQVERLKYSIEHKIPELIEKHEALPQAPKTIRFLAKLRKDLEKKSLELPAAEKRLKTIKSNMLKEIGMGQLNPVELFAEGYIDHQNEEFFDVVQDGFFIEVNLPNEPGIVGKLGAQFKRWGINIDSMWTAEDPDEDPSHNRANTISLVANLKPVAPATAYDLMRSILEIKKTYSTIQVTSNNFQLMDQRIQDKRRN